MINYSFSMAELEYFMLIFCRVSCLVYVVPFFSMNNTPRRVRIGLSFAVAGLLYFSITEKQKKHLPSSTPIEKEETPPFDETLPHSTKTQSVFLYR